MKNKVLRVMMAVLCMSTIIVTGCGQSSDDKRGNTESAVENPSENVNIGENAADSAVQKFENATEIELSDGEITVDGKVISNDTESSVYVANDIIFYLEGQDFTYGEGTEADAHSQAEADAHTVVHITKPGTYVLSGSLSAGQVAVDLGKDAKEDSNAVVTLVLNGVDIECSVAPAVIFYNVYECGLDDAETASSTVDTSAAGANVIIADGTVNNVSGSYVARIYEPDSVELSEDGTEVVDAKKLHKYDAAFYSKMSMNMNGDVKDSGVLNIIAENEGLDSELHLTINGGNINITSGNDGINTNEDGVSVTTVNSGILTIKVTGETKEGDGIDSNGWLVINGGIVIAQAYGYSADSGIDSDMGIHINGGTVIATGNMLDAITESAQNYAVFSFASSQKGGSTYALKNEAGDTVIEYTLENAFTNLILASADMTAGTYTLWQDGVQLAGSVGSMMGGMPGGFGGFGGEMPEGFTPPEGFEKPEEIGRPVEGGETFGNGELSDGVTLPDGMEFPEGMQPPSDGEFSGGTTAPEGMYRPEKGEIPEGMQQLPGNFEKPEGAERPVEGGETFGNNNVPSGFGGRGGKSGSSFGTGELSTEFVINDGGNYFGNISIAE